MASDNRAPSMAGTCARHVVGILFALSLTLNNRAVGYKEVSCAITLDGGSKLHWSGAPAQGTEHWYGECDGRRSLYRQRERQRSVADLLELHIFVQDLLASKYTVV